MPSSPLSLPATNTAGATDTSPSAPSTPFSSFSSQQSNISHAASSQPAPPNSTSQAPSSKLSSSSAQSTSSTGISAPPSRTQASTSPAPTSTTENNKSSKVATTPAQSPLPSGSPLAVSTSTSTLTSSTLVVPESSSISTNQSSSALISQSSASQPSSDIANSSSSSMALTAPQLSSMSAQATAGLSTVISSAVGSVSASSTGAFSVRSTTTVGRDTRSHIPAWVFVVIAILATALLAALLYIVWLFKRRARIRALQQRFPASENSMLWMRQSVGPPVMASTSTTGLIPRERVSPAAASVSPHTVYDGRASPIEADDVSVAQRSQRGRRLWAQLFSTAMSDSDAPMIRGSLQPSIVNPRTSTSRAHSFTSTNTHMLAGSVAEHHASGGVAERAPSILSIPSLRPSGECYGDESLASPTPSAEAAHGNVDLIPRASQINPSGARVASTTSYYGTSRESSQSSFSLFMTRSESSYPQTPLPVYVRNGEDGAIWPPPVPPIPYENTRLSRSSWLSSSAPSYHTGEAL